MASLFCEERKRDITERRRRRASEVLIIYLGTARTHVDLDPDFDERTGLLLFPNKNDWSLNASSVPTADSRDAYCPRDPKTYENARHKVVTKLLPKKGAKEGEDESKVEYKSKELRKDLLDKGVLPDSIREGMVSTFKELVAEGTLKKYPPSLPPLPPSLPSPASPHLSPTPIMMNVTKQERTNGRTTMTTCG